MRTGLLTYNDILRMVYGGMVVAMTPIRHEDGSAGLAWVGCPPRYPIHGGPPPPRSGQSAAYAIGALIAIRQQASRQGLTPA